MVVGEEAGEVEGVGTGEGEEGGRFYGGGELAGGGVRKGWCGGMVFGKAEYRGRRTVLMEGLSASGAVAGFYLGGVMLSLVLVLLLSCCSVAIDVLRASTFRLGMAGGGDVEPDPFPRSPPSLCHCGGDFSS